MRTRTAVLSVATALGVAACGSAAPAAKPSAPARPTPTPVTQSASAAGTGYFNMTMLGDDLQQKVNAKLATSDPGTTLTTVTCITTGTLTAECNGTYSNGQTESVGVNIDPSGDEYITQGS